MELFDLYTRRIQRFREETAHLAHIHLLPDRGRVQYSSERDSGTDDKNKRVVVDPGKLVIAADSLSGQELAEILRREYHLEVEMAAAGYVIALTSLADTEEGFLRLKNALIHIDKMLSTTCVERTAERHQQRLTMTGRRNRLCRRRTDLTGIRSR